MAKDITQPEPIEQPRPDRPRAFVLMPFSVDFQPVYEQLIRPALEEAGFSVSRADSVLDQQNILHSIVEGICRANLVVADISGLNPNVLYELGICHGLNIPAVMLTQSIEEAPFDLRAHRLTTYSTAFNEAAKLSDFLRTIGERHLAGRVTFGSPVSDFLREPPQPPELPGLAPPAGTLPKPVSRLGDPGGGTPPGQAPVPVPPDQVDWPEPLGWLDLISERDEVLSDLTATYQLLTESISKMGERIGSRTSQIGRVAASPPPGGAAAAANRVATEAARDMERHASDLRDLLPILEPKSQRLIELFTDPRLLEMQLSPVNADQREDTLAEFESLLTSNRQGLASIRGFRDSVRALGEQGISRETTRAAASLRLALDKVIGTIELVEAGLVRAIALLEDSPPAPSNAS